MRRNFFGEDLSNAISMQGTPHAIIKKIIKSKKINDLFGNIITLNTLMFILEKYFPDKFKIIVDQFRMVFPKIESMHTKSASEHFNFQHIGDATILLLKEQGVKSPIPLSEISSGMQKVLLILTDVIVAPKDSLYLIDEYENSLGVNAINFLPGFLTEFGEGKQFMLTTHHPMLINAIPVSSWFVFNRNGTHITIKYGNELVEKYGKSKQQRFTQLLNDPFYSRGAN
jgi:predicted ATPase